MKPEIDKLFTKYLNLLDNITVFSKDMYLDMKKNPQHYKNMDDTVKKNLEERSAILTNMYDKSITVTDQKQDLLELINSRLKNLNTLVEETKELKADCLGPLTPLQREHHSDILRTQNIQLESLSHY